MRRRIRLGTAPRSELISVNAARPAFDRSCLYRVCRTQDEDAAMPDAASHVIKSYDQQLDQLRRLLAEMGALVQNEVALAIDATLNRDPGAASRVVEADPTVDALERDVERFVIRLLALRQPMAGDLRHIVGALKISNDLERIGDHASNIAQRAIVLAQSTISFSLTGFARMAELVQRNVLRIVGALGDTDSAVAAEVWRTDKEIDDMYNVVFRELVTYMMEDPRNIKACANLLFVARNLERIGDHATNVAESIYYAVTGNELSGPRPKGVKTIVPAGGAGP
jgi:phosphate transport system protein